MKNANLSTAEKQFVEEMLVDCGWGRHSARRRQFFFRFQSVQADIIATVIACRDC